MEAKDNHSFSAFNEEVRKATTLDEFLAKQLGRAPKTREQLEAEVRHRLDHPTEGKIPDNVRKLIDAHLAGLLAWPPVAASQQAGSSTPVEPVAEQDCVEAGGTELGPAQTTEPEEGTEVVSPVAEEPKPAPLPARPATIQG